MFDFKGVRLIERDYLVLKQFEKDGIPIKPMDKDSYYCVFYAENGEIVNIDLGMVKYFNERICELKSLKELTLNYNDLEVISESIGELINLESLRIKDNKLKLIPNSFQKLQKLKYLDISNNQLEKFPEFICSLKNLEVLHIDRNKINNIPTDIKNLENLKELDISSNGFNKIPIEIFFLKNLRRLYIYKLEIEEKDEQYQELLKRKVLISGVHFIPRDKEVISDVYPLMPVFFDDLEEYILFGVIEFYKDVSDYVSKLDVEKITLEDFKKKLDIILKDFVKTPESSEILRDKGVYNEYLRGARLYVIDRLGQRPSKLHNFLDKVSEDYFNFLIEYALKSFYDRMYDLYKFAEEDGEPWW